MKRVLIISHNQFGYLTDTLKFCQYTASQYDITYIGWDYELKRIEVEGVKVKYVSRRTNLVMRNVTLLKAFHEEIKQNNYDLVFATYKFGISIVKCLNRQAPFVIDIRTLSVKSKWAVRLVNDFFLKLELFAFSEISVISEGVAKKLKLKRFHILPLGGEQFTTRPKVFEVLSLLYVGTLYNRDILECVKGFHIFLNDLDPKEPTPVFTIIGDSPGNELDEIRNYVKLNSLDEKIIIVGALPYPELNNYFEKSNVGISYIPIRSYYEYQPSTKTYEYLLSGLPVLATDTYENRKVINATSGALIHSDISSFVNGLKDINRRKDQFNSLYIMEEYAKFSWKRIINDNYLPMIDSLTT